MAGMLALPVVIYDHLEMIVREYEATMSMNSIIEARNISSVCSQTVPIMRRAAGIQPQLGGMPPLANRPSNYRFSAC